MRKTALPMAVRLVLFPTAAVDEGGSVNKADDQEIHIVLAPGSVDLWRAENDQQKMLAADSIEQITPPSGGTTRSKST